MLILVKEPIGPEFSGLGLCNDNLVQKAWTPDLKLYNLFYILAYYLIWFIFKQ